MNTVDLTKIDVKEWAQKKGELSGKLTLQDLPRLADICATPLPEGITDTTPILNWHAEAEVVDSALGVPQIWLYLQIEAEVPLDCERCLKPVLEELVLDYSYRFVATEEQAVKEDDESEEVVLALSRTLNLLALCEEELIMALPYMPLHEKCAQPLVEGLDKAGISLETIDEAFDAEMEKENPFSALEKLKKKLH